MKTLLFKEINAFLSSLVGYIAIGVFLLVNGLLLWIFPGAYNVFDSNYAGLGSMFLLAPVVFLFLIPAITMKAFAEEKKSGTIELLFTKPITDFQIIIAKYLAGVVLVLFSLLPTLVYFYCVYQLGAEKGNIDMGGLWGSYLGLLFLGSGFVAIGIYASSITDNQIISFLFGMLICAFCFYGFEIISYMGLFGSGDSAILKLGINEHYISMSRGVIDTRDIIYFLSLITVFLLLTKYQLNRRKN